MAEGILVGDAGGTNVRFGLARYANGRIGISDFWKHPGDAFDSFEQALDRYLSDTGANIAGLPAIFALAGPLIDGTVRLTNRDWTVSRPHLVARFACRPISLVNDFTAMARAVPELDSSRFRQLRPGTAEKGAPILVAGAGTGFGIATLVPLPDSQWHVISGEGGHMAYSPRTETETELFRRLQAKHGFVSNEMVCAGVALEDIHETLCAILNIPYCPTTPGDMLEQAASGSEIFRQLCEIRAQCIMSAAGDLVLANGALGGVVLAGGVTERLADYLIEPAALARFSDRNRHSEYLENCPIWLLHDPVAPLVGAAALFLREKKR